MCLVEIEKSPKPVASCAMPINAGMVIFTETPLVKKAREAVLEFLLINHPLDCPICDQGGECDLQDITLNYGSDCSRNFDFKRSVEDKECGPIIKTIMTRCIHCTRCIRFLTELAGVEIFGALGRGNNMEIGTFINKYVFTELSGNLIDLCPVGALTSKPYAFLARNWELKKIETIDFSDAVGSNIIVNTRNNFKNKDEILRILPKSNSNINDIWISDKIRYSFDGNFLNRLNNIIIKNNGNLNITWEPNFIKNYLTYLELCYNFSKTLDTKKILSFEIIGSIGTISNVEEIFFFYLYLKISGSSNFLINNTLYNFNLDLPLFYQFNDKFTFIEKSDLIFLVGINPRLESSMLNLRIRKHFFNTDIFIAYIGTFSKLTYPFIHLGTSTKIFFEIIEGKHFFCKKIRLAKKPLFLIGAEFGLRFDSKILQNLIRFLLKKSYLNIKSTVGLNTVHQNLSQIHLCDLGLNLTSKSSMHLLLKNKNLIKQISLNSLNSLNYLTKKNFIYFYNNINITKNNFGVLNNQKNIELSLSTHNNILNNNSNLNIPIKTSFEENSIFLNTEGTAQKNFKVISSNQIKKSSYNIWKIFFKITLKKLFNKNFFNIMYIENPFLKNINKPRKCFYLNFLSLTTICNKIYFSPYNLHLKNFYMTDNLSENSKTMAECALFIKDNRNFLI